MCRRCWWGWYWYCDVALLDKVCVLVDFSVPFQLQLLPPFPLPFSGQPSLALFARFRGDVCVRRGRLVVDVDADSCRRVGASALALFPLISLATSRAWRRRLIRRLFPQCNGRYRCRCGIRGRGGGSICEYACERGHSIGSGRDRWYRDIVLFRLRRDVCAVSSGANHVGVITININIVLVSMHVRVRHLGCVLVSSVVCASMMVMLRLLDDFSLLYMLQVVMSLSILIMTVIVMLLVLLLGMCLVRKVCDGCCILRAGKVERRIIQVCTRIISQMLPEQRCLTTEWIRCLMLTRRRIPSCSSYVGTISVTIAITASS